MGLDSNLATAQGAGLSRVGDPSVSSLANGLSSADGSVQLYLNNSGQLVPPAGTAPALATLLDGATIAWAWSGNANTGGNLAAVTLGGNRTLNITGAQIGQKGLLKVTQDGTGSRTLTITGGKHPTLSTGAGAIDVLELTCVGANTYLATAGLNVA